MNARRWPFVVAAAVGVGLALAPVAFRMFERAPKGGDMIDGFQPYMNVEKIDEFRGDLATIGAAHAELPSVDTQKPGIATFQREWPAINDDMGSMLATMRSDIGRYDGVAALPPFPLFPWFFVIPGLLTAGVALSALRRQAPWQRIAVAGLGVGLIAAPAVFQMFTRAPGGAAMIDDFKPFMTTEKVVAIQGYFLTIGAAEGQFRHEVLPTTTPADVPAIRTFVDRWPTISNDMAPMIGAMSDNVDNFDAVVALPPFWLFPWFFVVPGVILIGLAWASRRPPAQVSDPDPARELEGAPS